MNTLSKPLYDDIDWTRFLSGADEIIDNISKKIKDNIPGNILKSD